MSTFTDSMDDLIRQVDGRWSAHCEVDQIYAHYQEAHPEFNHPRGGQAFYLRDTVYHGAWLQKMAKGIIGPNGVDVEGALVKVAEGMVRGVFERAPREFHDLRRSGRPTVVHNYAQVYTRAPDVGRLSEAALRLKGQIRSGKYGRR